MFMRLVPIAAAAALVSSVAVAAEINVGGKNFTEQLLMTEMTSLLLEANGFDVNKREGMGSKVVRAAQENGQVDIYWEYTGTSLITYNKVKERLSAEDTYKRVKELDAKRGLVWLTPSKANNTYALAMRASDAKAKGISTLSDLAKSYNDKKALKMGVNAEFPKRPDGLIGLQKAYGFEATRANIAAMQSGLVYQALKESQVDVGLVFATDGRIAAFDFLVLKDDKGFFPAYALAPVIRKETLDKYPKLAGLLESLASKFDDATLQALNARVDVQKETIEDVSASFLKQHGLIN
jgi:osmoprotectant transport system substrate-binding protein